jgi:hypothetical protein
MNKRTALIIVTIILLLILGVLAYQNIKTTGKIVSVLFDYGGEFNSKEYCEVQTINETAVCLPEGVCEFQTDSDGTEYCLRIR